MAQKKCSKCGELNPPEAVMCWACYTPLSSAGAVAGIAPRGASSSGGTSEYSTAKKAVEPWQLGLIGVGVLVAVVMGGRSLMGAGGTVATESASERPPSFTPDSTSYNTSSAPAPSIVATGGGSSANAIRPTALPAPGQMNFTISVPPKRDIPWATMAIVPTQPNATPQAAASLAASARQQLSGTGSWTGLYIYVFSDQQAALQLKTYQAERNGKPLTTSDYQALKAIWPSALTRYEYSKGWEAIRYPSANPTGWWEGQSKYNKAKL